MFTRLRFGLAVVLLMSGTSLADPADRAAASEQAFTAGIDAARDGDLEAALGHFEAARQMGSETPPLLYNLGVTNFRLGRLAAAAAAFLRLREQPEWAALASYNLGLVAARQGNVAAARQHFHDARARSADPKLTALADARLAATPQPDEQPVRPARAWQGLVSLAGGYDDNVVLADDRLRFDAGEADDLFAELLAAGRRPLAGSARAGLNVDVGAYYRAHADLHEFDFGALSTSLLWHRRSGPWRFAVGPGIELQVADGSRYATVAGARAQLDHLGAVAWQLRLDTAYYDGSSTFDFISGWRHRARAQASRAYDWGSLQIGYEVETNDRNDLTQEGQFFSYSPIRHGPFATVTGRLTSRLQIEVGASAWWSDYRDDNRFTDATGTPIQAPRDQDTLWASARLGYRLAGAWLVWAQAQHVRSDSRIVRYDYEGQRYLIGLESHF